jgi:hypothetical protein
MPVRFAMLLRRAGLASFFPAFAAALRQAGLLFRSLKFVSQKRFFGADWLPSPAVGIVWDQR